MNNPLNELNERFKNLVETEDSLIFFEKLNDYLLFVAETPPLNTVAREEKITFAINLKKPFLSIGTTRPFLRTFHAKLVREVKSKYETGGIPITINIQEEQIYLTNNPARCYSVRSRAEDGAKRFKAIVLLLRDESGMSAERLAKHLEKNDLSNTRSEIRKINGQFNKKVSKTGKLIILRERGGKNMYLPNRAIFDFEIVSLKKS